MSNFIKKKIDRGIEILNVAVNEAVNTMKIKKSRKKICELKGKFNGKRCFIIGNGPSLTKEDLLKIKDEYTFATNSIMKIVDQDIWKPKFYVIQDYRVLEKRTKDINKYPVDYKFVPIISKLKYATINNAIYLGLVVEDFYPNYPKFSPDVSVNIYEGLTVTYAAIQIAVTLGFSEIFLLGVDHNYSVALKPDGTIEKNQGVNDYANLFSNSEKIEEGMFLPRLDETTLAYKAARKYADGHGICIYNATRGGKLEVFKRISLEEVF